MYTLHDHDVQRLNNFSFREPSYSRKKHSVPCHRHFNGQEVILVLHDVSCLIYKAQLTDKP